MITYLNVPYVQKDEAKSLGAQWSPAKRKWFITDIDDIEPFLKWMPEHLKHPCRPVTK